MKFVRSMVLCQTGYCCYIMVYGAFIRTLPKVKMIKTVY